ncbi:MAG: YcgN family cysteine cluster protein [Parvularculaceae bacterium]
MTAPFWETKSLAAMTQDEWESLCDGCGKCCLVLLDEEETGRLYETNVACRLFDVKKRRCTDYANRTRRVKDCVALTPGNAGALDWMPESCAYRRLARGEGLPDWHPLLTRTFKSVVDAGVAVGRAVNEAEVDDEDVWDYVVAVRPRPRNPRKKKRPVKRSASR